MMDSVVVVCLLVVLAMVLVSSRDPKRSVHGGRRPGRKPATKRPKKP